MKTLDGGRIGIASQALGLGEGAIEEAIKYTKERVQFGKRLSQFQNTQFQIADMTAYRAPDGVWFLGDALFGAETLDKYHLSYLYDAEQALASFDAAEALTGAAFVPAHVKPAEPVELTE